MLTLLVNFSLSTGSNCTNYHVHFHIIDSYFLTAPSVSPGCSCIRIGNNTLSCKLFLFKHSQLCYRLLLSRFLKPSFPASLSLLLQYISFAYKLPNYFKYSMLSISMPLNLNILQSTLVLLSHTITLLYIHIQILFLMYSPKTHSLASVIASHSHLAALHHQSIVMMTLFHSLSSKYNDIRIPPPQPWILLLLLVRPHLQICKLTVKTLHILALSPLLNQGTHSKYHPLSVLPSHPHTYFVLLTVIHLPLHRLQELSTRPSCPLSHMPSPD